MLKTLLKNYIKQNSNSRLIRTIRPLPEIPFDEGKSLKEKLAELNPGDPELDFKVDIGLPPPPPISKKELREQRRFTKLKKQDLGLERKSRTLTLEVDIETIRQEWLKTEAPKQIQMVAEHYGVFDDLFEHAYFTPYVTMEIYYPQEDRGLFAPVCRGNVVKPKEALSQPNVKYESDPQQLWTLTLVNPDGHLTEDNMEYIHWFVGNIPGDDISKGETIWDYLPPFPPKGVGFQRLIFVLYKQERKIDYSALQKQIPCLELKDRSFRTLDFYRDRQSELTPAGLSFFQCDWDRAVTKIFHEILNMEEPEFEYDFPSPVYNQQIWYPKKEPFNMYLDRYRDPRDVNEEYLLRKLKELHPFEVPKPPFPYPKAVAMNFRNMRTWEAKKEAYYRLGRGRVSKLEREEYE